MASFDRNILPVEMVVRPTGIWDSRAPFHTFVKVNKANTRGYEITRMCLEKVTHDLPSARSDGIPLKDYMTPKNDVSRRAWANYEKAQSRVNLEGKLQSPAYGHVGHDVLMSKDILRYSTLVRSMTLFEQYVSCWLLNYLICKIEIGQKWNPVESEFARQISPVHGAGTPPQIFKVLNSINLIKESLGNLVHPSHSTGKSRSYFLLHHMHFWVHYRNCVIHNGGLCTPRTYNRHLPFWLEEMAEFSRDKFRERYPLSLSFELLHRCRFTIYHSVLALEKALEKALEEMSLGRRGHPWAPEPRSPTHKFHPDTC
jgi:hypothetical protein